MAVLAVALHFLPSLSLPEFSLKIALSPRLATQRLCEEELNHDFKPTRDCELKRRFGTTSNLWIASSVNMTTQ